MGMVHIRKSLGIAGLSQPEQALLTVLAFHTGKDGTCWPSIPTLSREMGSTERTVRKMVRKLEHYGFIAVHKKTNSVGGSGSNLYELTIEMGSVDRIPVSQPTGGPCPVDPHPLSSGPPHISKDILNHTDEPQEEATCVAWEGPGIQVCMQLPSNPFEVDMKVHDWYEQEKKNGFKSKHLPVKANQQMEQCWKEMKPQYTKKGFVPMLTLKEQKMIKLMVGKVGESDSPAVFKRIMEDWPAFLKQVKLAKGLLKGPTEPQLEFILKHIDVGVNMGAEKSVHISAKPDTPSSTTKKAKSVHIPNNPGVTGGGI